MKKRYLFGIMAFLLFISLTYAAEATLVDSPDLIHYWELDGNYLDDVGSADGVANGTPESNATCKIGSCYHFTASDPDYLEFPVSTGLSDSFTLSYWVKLDDTSAAYYPLQTHVVGDYTNYWTNGNSVTGGYITAAMYDGSNNPSYANNSAASLVTTRWQHWAFVRNTTSDDFYIFIDGKRVAGGEDTTTSVPSYAYVSVGQDDNNRKMNGYLDEIAVFDRALTRTEINELYNNSYGVSIEYLVTAAAAPVNSTITLKDFWNLSSILTFNATIDGTTYKTTTGTITTPYLDDSTSEYDVLIQAENYLNRTYINYNISSNLEALSFPFTKVWVFDNESNALDNFSISLANGSQTYAASDFGGLVPIYNYTYTLSVDDFVYNGIPYFDAATQVSGTTPLMNTTLSTHKYTALYVRNANNESVNEFTINWTDPESNNGLSSTTTGVLYLPINSSLWQLNLTNATDGSGLPLAVTEINLSPSSYLENYTFYPDQANALSIYIYDADTANLITENITITLSGAEARTNATSNGTITFLNLTSGSYNVSFTGSTYTTTQYSVTINEGYASSLDAYMSKGTAEVTFTARNKLSNTIIEGATITIEKVVGASWQIVAALSTDITGRAQYEYTPDATYRFSVSKADYITKEFTLSPIIFTEYDILLDPSTQAAPDYDYYGVSVIKTIPDYFDENNHTITFKFVSPEGELISYYVNMSYPQGHKLRSGSNAYGETLLIPIQIISPQWQDYVYINFSYTTTSSTKLFTLAYMITLDPANYSMIGQKNTDYGMGDLEKALIGTTTTIVTASLATYYGGALAGGIMGVFVLGMMFYLGLLPLWALLMAATIVFFVAVWRFSQ